MLPTDFIMANCVFMGDLSHYLWLHDLRSDRLCGAHESCEDLLQRAEVQNHLTQADTHPLSISRNSLPYGNREGMHPCFI